MTLRPDHVSCGIEAVHARDLAKRTEEPTEHDPLPRVLGDDPAADVDRPVGEHVVGADKLSVRPAHEAGLPVGDVSGFSGRSPWSGELV